MNQRLFQKACKSHTFYSNTKAGTCLREVQHKRQKKLKDRFHITERVWICHSTRGSDGSIDGRWQNVYSLLIFEKQNSEILQFFHILNNILCNTTTKLHSVQKWIHLALTVRLILAFWIVKDDSNFFNEHGQLKVTLCMYGSGQQVGARRVSRQSAHEGGTVVSPTHWQPCVQKG